MAKKKQHNFNLRIDLERVDLKAFRKLAKQQRNSLNKQINEAMISHIKMTHTPSIKEGGL